MGRTPPRARRRFAVAVVLFSFLSLTLPYGHSAIAKLSGDGSQVDAGQAKGNGKGNGNGGGRGNGGGNGNGGGSSPAPTSLATPTAGSPAAGGGGDEPRGGNGNGNDNGRGKKGNRNDGQGSATPSPGSTSGSTPKTNSGSSGSGSGSGSSGAAQPPSGGSTSPGAVTAASASPTSTVRLRRETRGRGTQQRRRSPAARRRALADRRSAARARSRRSAAARRGEAVGPLATGITGTTPAAQLTAGAEDGNGGADRNDRAARDESPVVVRTLRSVVEVIPGFVKAIIAALALALLIASVAWFILARNARFLRRQRAKLVGEIGVLQGALLPNVPPELSRLEASVAYRPAEGVAAGGDFYDAFALDRGHVGIVVGDVAGHGKEALMHTALLRYTMRAYLEAGLEPRAALQVAGRVLDRGFDTLATVVLAVYDPDRHVLRYATAGHPPPVFLGEADHVPVTRSSSPPIGAMLPTGLRQTTVSLPAGSAACFFTDGLIEARRDDDLVGRLGLVEIIRELGPHATASQVLDKVAETADHVGDDMAACMFRVGDGPDAASTPPRVEELEVGPHDLRASVLDRFLAACGIEEDDIAAERMHADRMIARFGGAVVRVTFHPEGPLVVINPTNVESLAAVRIAV